MRSRSGWLGVVAAVVGLGLVASEAMAGSSGAVGKSTAKPPTGQSNCTPRLAGERLSIYGISWDTTLKEAQARLCTKGERLRGDSSVVIIQYQEMRAVFFQNRLAAIKVNKALPDIHARDIYADLRKRFGKPDHILKQEADKEYLSQVDYELDKEAAHPYQLCWGGCSKLFVGGSRQADRVLGLNDKLTNTVQVMSVVATVPKVPAVASGSDAAPGKPADKSEIVSARATTLVPSSDTTYLLATVKQQAYTIDMRNQETFKQMEAHLKQTRGANRLRQIEPK